MSKRTSRQNLIVQGSILAVASIVVRIIGFFYRVPLANVLGDVGLGYYGVAFSIYTFFLMLSTYGFPAAISRINASLLAEHDYKESRHLVRAALVLAVIIGAFFSVLLWFGAGTIARIYENENIVWSIKALAPALFFFSILSVLRGYFQGFNTMVPTAISQIVEQLFNAVFSIVFAYALMGKGIEFGASGGTLGTGAGTLAGLFVMGFVYIGATQSLFKKWEKTDHYNESVHKPMPYYWKIILASSIPIVMGSLITYFAAIIDTFMLYKSMINYGVNQDIASAIQGVYQGKYLLIINLPIVAISSSLTSSLIPSVSSSMQLDDVKEVQNKVRATFKMVLMLLIPSVVGVIVFARPILAFLFSDQSNIGIAADSLRLGGISIVLVGATNILAGILIGINQLKTQIATTAVGVGVKIVLNTILLYVFGLNVFGLIFANILFGITMVSLKGYFVYKYIGEVIDVNKSIIKPIISALIMGCIGYGAFWLVGVILPIETITLMVAIVISIGIYGICILKLQVVGEREIRQMPKGHKLVPVLEKLHLI